MVELDEAALIAKLASIDAQIDAITSILGQSGQGGAQMVAHTIGSIQVDGTARLDGLREARKVYQDLLDRIPKTITRDHGYAIRPGTGSDVTDYVGDEGGVPQ